MHGLHASGGVGGFSSVQHHPTEYHLCGQVVSGSRFGVDRLDLLLTDQVPVVAGEPVRRLADVGGAIPGGDGLARAAAAVIVGEVELESCASRHGRDGRHVQQPVLSVPNVRPPSVVREVAVSVVSEVHF